MYAADEQSDCDVELGVWVALADAVLNDRGIKGDAELSMLFIDEAAITSLNERFMGRAGATDVLAFPVDDVELPSGRYPDSCGSGPEAGSQLECASEGAPPLLVGDVVICPVVAERNAKDHGVSLDDEIALLVVHGILHLLGMDHVSTSDAVQMEAVERQILERHYSRVRRLCSGAGDDVDGGDG